MATYTPNYGLHQWVPGDQFLREDFNEDFKKIDTAIYRVANRMEPLNYNIYHLALQHYYAGGTNILQKALVFDGFCNDKRIENRELGLELDTESGVLRLGALGETDFTNGMIGSLLHEETMVRATHTWTPTGSGHFTGLTLYFTGCLKIELFEDGVQTALATGTFTGGGQGGIFCPLEADVGAGCSYQLKLTNPEGPVVFYYGNDPEGSTTWLVYTRHVTSVPITKAAMTGRRTDLGSQGHTKALAWVRYQKGLVALALHDGSCWRDMKADAVRSTVNAQGAACQEAAFSLEGLTASTLQTKLTLSGTAGKGCIVYDYGVTVL